MTKTITERQDATTSFLLKEKGLEKLEEQKEKEKEVVAEKEKVNNEGSIA